MGESVKQDSGERERDCIQCSRCLEVCPLVRSLRQEELGPKAKQLLQRALVSGEGGLGERETSELASICLGCTLCEDVCSQGLSGARTVSRLRAAHPGWRSWLWKRWMKGGETLWPLARGLSRILPVPSGGRLERLKGLSHDEITPFLILETCGDGPGGGDMADQPVALFAGCTADRLEPGWGRAAGALLDSLGMERVEADFACCGATLTHAGLAKEGVEAARVNLTAWDNAGRPRVVTICASCHAGLAEYVHLEGVDQEVAGSFVEKLAPLSSLLAACRWGIGPGAPERIQFHHPCHDRNGHDLALLAAVLGERLVPGKRGNCCGMGGIMQLGRPALASAVSETCWETMRPEPGGLVLTGCSGCVLTLRATAPEGVVVGHWLDALVLPPA